MKLLKVIIRNFLSFREATVDLLDRGLVSIEGKILDKSGADSNGSGKSTLINAILWCNYGDAGKDIKSVDEVVNSKAGKDCMVACHWLDEVTGTIYIVTRYRKHAKYKNSLTLEVANGIDADNVDSTKGTTPETQLLVNSILGADQATFEASCFARQDNAPDIPGMTDTGLKTLLERVLPFDDLSPRYSKAKAVHDAHTAFVNDLSRAVEKLELRREFTRQEIVEAQAGISNWAYEEADRVARIQQRINSTLEAIEADRAAMKPQDKIDAGLKKYKALVEAYNDTDRQRHLADLRIARADLEKARKAVDNVALNCRSCGKAFDNAEEAKAVAEREMREAKDKYNVIMENEDRVAADYADYCNNKATLDRLEQLQRNQERRLENIAKAELLIDEWKANIDQVPTNHYQTTLTRLSERFTELEGECFTARTQYEGENARTQVLRAVMDTYSPKGVRYHILETATPALNDRTAYYLGILSDGAIKATWSTVTKLKSGDYKEKFSIDVSSSEAKSYGGLSGGEKRKVRLACFFALQDLIAKRATKSISLWCGDEIDHALDSSGLERLMDLLHAKTATKSTILVISHNELRAWIPNYSTVIKEKGISRITGYLSAT